jgi:hypothetical protein
MSEVNCDIGLIGLAVMGQNLVLNMNDHGYKVAVFNRTVSKVDDFVANEAKGTQVAGAHSIEEMCKLLKTPRRVMIMVKAGDPYRWRQFAAHRHHPANQGSCRKRHSVHRNGRFRRRRGSAIRPVDYARWE